MKILTIIFIAMLLCNNCANRLPLSGGPEDKTPPVIIEFSPKQKTINYADDEIILKFSKYMNKTKVEENVFFSPAVEYEANWSGKEMEIEFLKPLDSNTTYALMIGTDYTDIRNNQPAQAFNLVFSTGNVIDTGAIEGKLYDKDPSGAFIYAYSIDNMESDTFNISGKMPQYRSQVGTSGNFTIPALKEGNYRLFAIRDNYGNEIYDSGSDPFGASIRNFTVENGISDFVHIKIGPPKDKTGSMLFDAFAKSNKIIAMNFSEKIDTNSISTENIILQDSISKKKINIKAVYISINSGNIVEAVLSESVDTNSVWELIIPSDSTIVVSDSLGNHIQDTANTVSFVPYPDKEWIKPELVSYPFPDSTMKISPDREFSFIFNTAIPQDFVERTSIIDLTDSASIKVMNVINGNILKIIPSQQLKSDKMYQLSLDLKGAKAMNDFAFTDTTINLRFKTGDIRSFGSASGTIKNGNCDGNYIVILKSKITENNIFQTIADSTGKWIFQQIPPETYQIEVFCDMDYNKKYSYGDDFPFQFSEPFYMIKEEIVIQARWDVEDIVLTIPD